MGSGSSKEKEKGPTKGGGAKPASVVANEINSPVKLGTDVSKSKTVNRTETETGKVSSFPIKVQERLKEPPEVKQTRSNTSAERTDWEGDSIDATMELVDNILGETAKPSVKYGNTSHHSEHEREQNSYNSKQSQELYPETYAQRHIRENYTLGQDRLLREKTIFRNPKEWEESDDDSNEAKKTFNLSRFRAANPGTTNRDKEIFTSNDDFETPRYLKESIERNEVPPVQTTKLPKAESKLLPAYSKEEEDLMAELMGEEEFFGHQSMNYVNAKT